MARSPPKTRKRSPPKALRRSRRLQGKAPSVYRPIKQKRTTQKRPAPKRVRQTTPTRHSIGSMSTMYVPSPTKSEGVKSRRSYGSMTTLQRSAPASARSMYSLERILQNLSPSTASSSKSSVSRRTPKRRATPKTAKRRQMMSKTEYNQFMQYLPTIRASV